MAILGENREDLRRLAQAGGALPPYSDLGRVLSHAVGMPEYESHFDSIRFQSLNTVRVDRTSFQNLAWEADLYADDDRRLVLKISPDYYANPRGTGGCSVEASQFKKELDDFLSAIRKIADIKSIEWEPGMITALGSLR